MILLVNNRNTKQDNSLSNITGLKRFFSYFKISYYETKSIEVLPMHIQSKIKGIVLSGSELKITSPLLFSEYAHNFYYMEMFPNIPILGICFGCQLLAMVHGYTVHYLGKYIRNTKQMIQLSDHFLFSDMYSEKTPIHPFRVYFSGLINNSNTNMSPAVKEIAYFCIENTKYPCAFEFSPYTFGMMMHPEYQKSTYPVLYEFIKHTKCDILRESPIRKLIIKRSHNVLSRKRKERKNKTVRIKKE